MDAESILRSRGLTVAALLLATVLLAIGVQQATIRVDDAEVAIMVSLTVTAAVAAALVLGGAARSGTDRTPYW